MSQYIGGNSTESMSSVSKNSGLIPMQFVSFSDL